MCHLEDLPLLLLIGATFSFAAQWQIRCSKYLFAGQDKSACQVKLAAVALVFQPVDGGLQLAIGRMRIKLADRACWRILISAVGGLLALFQQRKETVASHGLWSQQFSGPSTSHFMHVGACSTAAINALPPGLEPSTLNRLVTGLL